MAKRIEKRKGRRVGRYIAATLLLALGILTCIRWKAWFGNPAEEPYTVEEVPSRVLLTFGNEGELSRYVSWMCGEELDSTACLYLADTVASDSPRVYPAVGEVFVSRAGKAAYYRVQLTDLQPDMEYHYWVKNAQGASPVYRFRTTDPRAQRFSFLYVGDVQDTVRGEVNSMLRDAVTRHSEVEFLAFAGDLVERPTHKYWEEAFLSIDSLCTTLPILNVTGNHDYLKYLIRKCERRFALVFPYFLQGMEERDDANHLFSFTYHNTDFFLLDTDRGIGFLYAQRQWLKEQLAASTSKHKIALFHHPLYSVRRRSSNLDVLWMFADQLRDSGVELVMQGHEHGYARCTSSEEPLQGHLCQRPPLYVISHCSPKEYRLRPSERFSPVVQGSRYYQVVDVDAESVTLKAYDAADHALIDSVRIVR